jgi:hypothetical protein
MLPPIFSYIHPFFSFAVRLFTILDQQPLQKSHIVDQHHLHFEHKAELCSTQRIFICLLNRYSHVENSCKPEDSLIRKSTNGDLERGRRRTSPVPSGILLQGLTETKKRSYAKIDDIPNERKGVIVALLKSCNTRKLNVRSMDIILLP